MPPCGTPGAVLPSDDFPSLFGSVDSAVDSTLPGYRHLGTLDAFRKRKDRPSSELGSDITRRVYSEIAPAFRRLVENPARRHSKENWRCHHPCLDCTDASGEVGLERALVGACVRRGRDDWWNQVPVASGLVNSSAGKRRAIDLVRHRGGQSYEFVELKINSDSAFYATVEILQYGFVWLLTRRSKSALGYSGGTLLDAEDVRLNVLAPTRYYRGVDFKGFEEGVSSALGEIATPYEAFMTFRIVRFPEDFDWPGYSQEALGPLLDSLFPP